MAHEKSKTVQTDRGFANIDTVGSDAGKVLDGQFFRTLIDALLEARTRSAFGHDLHGTGVTRNPAARKNMRDKNETRNPPKGLLEIIEEAQQK